MKSKLNFKITVSVILVAICLIIGVLLVIFGIRDTLRLDKTTENYDTAEGYFSDYAFYDYGDNGKPIYKLIYNYEVDGKTYTVSTDYGTQAIPETGSTRTVRYNPDNPQEAVLSGADGNKIMIYLGAFFILGALIFIIAGMSVLGFFNKLKIDVIGTVFGLVFTVVGIGILAFAAGNAGSLWGGVKSFGPFILIPFLFIAAGIFTLIKALFFNKKEDDD